MIRLLGARLAQAVLVAWAIATLCFFMAHFMPGDAAYRIASARLGGERATLVDATRVREELGLDRPLIAQYGEWLAHTIRGDFGVSLVSGKSVLSELAYYGGYSLTLGFASFLLAYLIAIPLGIAAGLNPGGWADRIVLAGGAVFAATPTFVAGLLLVLLFALTLRWLPPAGYRTPAHLVLPSITLALGLAAYSVQIVRSAISGVQNSGFMTFARLKGLGRWETFLRHTPRNAAVPIVTFAGLQVAAIVDGFLMAETLFNYPGLGKLIVTSILSSDIPLVMGACLLIGLVYSLVNLAVDLLVGVVDPRAIRTDAS